MCTESELGADAIWFCAICNYVKCFIGRRKEKAGNGGKDFRRKSKEN